MTDPAVARVLELAGLADLEAIDQSRLLDGRAFLDLAQGVRAKWGRGDEVLAAVGEPTWLVGGTGVGKTTVSQQVMLACLELLPDALGYPVVPADRRVLYLAMDRPAQAAGSLARMAPDLDVLEDRLRVWKGPPPSDLARNPRLLVDLAEKADASDVFIDSMKDAALGLSDDEVGAGVNRGLQEACAAGLEVFVMHHNRKPAGNTSAQLADVYGSTWLTAGAGSVLLLEGRAGDLVVTLKHLKQPAEEVGPLELIHDHTAGRTVVAERVDLYQLLTVAGADGITVDQAARALYRVPDPDPNQREKARRRLNKLTENGDATVTTGPGKPSVYRVVDLLRPAS